MTEVRLICLRVKKTVQSGFIDKECLFFKKLVPLNVGNILESFFTAKYFGRQIMYCKEKLILE